MLKLTDIVHLKILHSWLFKLCYGLLFVLECLYPYFINRIWENYVLEFLYPWFINKIWENCIITFMISSYDLKL